MLLNYERLFNVDDLNRHVDDNWLIAGTQTAAKLQIDS